jgi:hypothetical protein
LVRVPNTAPGSNQMRKTMPFRWIEEAEARKVIAIARSQSPAPPFTPAATKAPWSARVRRRFAAEPTSPSPAEATVPDGAVEPRRS